MSELRTTFMGTEPNAYFINRVDFGPDGEQVGTPYAIEAMKAPKIEADPGNSKTFNADLDMNPNLA